LELLEAQPVLLAEDLLDELEDFLLRLHSVREDLVAAALHSERALALDRVGAILAAADRDVREDERDVLPRDVAVLVKVIYVKS